VVSELKILEEILQLTADQSIMEKARKLNTGEVGGSLMKLEMTLPIKGISVRVV